MKRPYKHNNTTLQSKMTAPKIYRYDDTNAPVVNGQRGSAISLLKACLVDGYGDKPAAGWTMPYSDAAGKAVFRGNPYSGSGFYLQVDNTGSSTYTSVLNAYENMTDVNTGVKPFISGSNANGIFTSSQNNTSPRPWILFADDRFFILVIWKATSLSQFASNMTNRTGLDGGYNCVCLFGDGIPLQSSDSFFSVLFPGKSSDQGPGLAGASGTSSNDYQYVARDSGGNESRKSCALITGGGPIYSSGSGALYHDSLPTRISGQEIVSRPYVNNGLAFTMRGYLPGLWFACHKATEFDQFENLEIGNHKFMVIKMMTSASYRQVFLVDVSEHWRP